MQHEHRELSVGDATWRESRQISGFCFPAAREFGSYRTVRRLTCLASCSLSMGHTAHSPKTLSTPIDEFFLCADVFNQRAGKDVNLRAS